MIKNMFASRVVFSVMVSFLIFAQIGSAAEHNKKEVAYHINDFGANWFVGMQGGVNIFMNNANGYSGRTGGALDVNVGRWFSPDLGLRIGYHGLKGRMNGAEYAGGEDDLLKETFQFWYLHADIMWNAINSFAGYREDRFWHVIPCVHFGPMRIFDHQNDAYDSSTEKEHLHKYDNEFAFGVGLYNTLRFSERIYGIIDIRETMFSSRYHAYSTGGISSNLSATLGLGINLGKVGWDLCENSASGDCSVSLKEAIKALEEAKAQNDELNKTLENQLSAEVEPKILVDTVFSEHGIDPSSITLYFRKSSAELPFSELVHLKEYALRELELNPDCMFYITGTADKETGTAEFNEKLCIDRVKNAANFLVNEVGIDEKQVNIKGISIIDAGSDARLSRTVKIEH